MTPPRSERPLRADARRNRARILDAAETVFTTHGSDASTEQVAAAAGVGIGTVFRHFPTKEELLQAVLIGQLERMVGRADELLAADDTGNALFSYFREAVGQSATKNIYADALASAGIDLADAISPIKSEVFRVLDALLARAQQAGTVRADVTVQEVIALIVGASRALEHLRWDGQAGERILAVIFAGLRVPPSAP